MAVAAFLASGCGAFPAVCLRYLLRDSVVGFRATPAARLQMLSSEMRLFAMTGFHDVQTTFSTFPAETVTPLRRRHVWVSAVGFHS